MRLPNLLGSRRGRIAAFFFLYLTEGIPQGFTATVVGTQLRRLDVSVAQIGALMAMTMLPWAFKWAYGPLIDLFVSRRFGHRRGWILLTQCLMALTLALLPLLSLPQQLGLFTALLLVHNTFAAMQDVAVDGLACVTLQENERAFASGMMFAGQSLGMVVGGGGALLLASQTSFNWSICFVAAAIAFVTLLVVVPMDEGAAPVRERLAGSLAGSRAVALTRQLGGFAGDAVRAFLGSRAAMAGLLFDLLPICAMALSLSLQSNLAVELGLPDSEIAQLGIWSSVLTAISCVIGGYISDRVDRRRALVVYVLLLSLPGLYLMMQLQAAGWVMPRHGDAAPAALAAPSALVHSFWLACLAYHLFFGLIYGARAALFIDLTQPSVAATQFAVYMALTNLSIAYSQFWQGQAAARWGYPTTLLIDSVVGLACLVFLPWMKLGAKPAEPIEATPPVSALPTGTPA
ncbi:MAG TPA: MFS transporter [Burkholderiaceae bacterium]|jgi:PAT family beta-lactamase induction signal transducer AmpG